MGKSSKCSEKCICQWAQVREKALILRAIPSVQPFVYLTFAGPIFLCRVPMLMPISSSICPLLAFLSLWILIRASSSLFPFAGSSLSLKWLSATVSLSFPPWSLLWGACAKICQIQHKSHLALLAQSLPLDAPHLKRAKLTLCAHLPSFIYCPSHMTSTTSCTKCLNYTISPFPAWSYAPAAPSICSTLPFLIICSNILGGSA